MYRHIAAGNFYVLHSNAEAIETRKEIDLYYYKLDKIQWNTSIKIPSTPTATAVRAMQGISSRKPPLATPPPSSCPSNGEFHFSTLIYNHRNGKVRNTWFGTWHKEITLSQLKYLRCTYHCQSSYQKSRVVKSSLDYKFFSNNWKSC